MPEEKSYRLAKVAGELGVGVHTIVEHLQKKGVKLEDTKPTSKLDQATYEILLQDFQSDKKAKDLSKNIEIQMKRDREQVVENTPVKPKPSVEDTDEDTFFVKDLGSSKKPTVVKEEKPVEPIKERATTLEGPKIIGKIDLSDNKASKPKPVEEKIVEVAPVVVPEPQPEPVVEEKKIIQEVETPPAPVVELKEEPTAVEELPEPITETVSEKEIEVIEDPVAETEDSDDNIIRACDMGRRP